MLDQLADALGLRRLERAVRRGPSRRPGRAAPRAAASRRRRTARAAAGPPRWRAPPARASGRPCRAGSAGRRVGERRRLGRPPSAACRTRRRGAAHLVRDLRPAARRQHVAHGLPGEDAADRLGQRRHAAVRRAPAPARRAPRPGGRGRPAARSRASTSATSPTGMRLNAVRRAIRGGIGSAGICEVTWSSMNRDAAHTRSVSTPCSIPRPVSASHSTSAATRFSAQATG